MDCAFDSLFNKGFCQPRLTILLFANQVDNFASERLSVSNTFNTSLLLPFLQTGDLHVFDIPVALSDDVYVSAILQGESKTLCSLLEATNQV